MKRQQNVNRTELQVLPCPSFPRVANKLQNGAHAAPPFWTKGHSKHALMPMPLALNLKEVLSSSSGTPPVDTRQLRGTRI